MRLWLERLEDRLTPTLLTVINGADAGPGSLRDALAKANSGDVIDFAANVRTISLTTGGLTIATNVSIQNDQGGPVTVDGGGGNFTVFTVNKGVTATLSTLTIANAVGGIGGGVDNNGTLSVSDCAFTNNFADGPGAGIENAGQLTVSDSTFFGNNAGSTGGGIDNIGTLTVSDSTFSGNSAGFSGGGVFDRGGATTLNGVILVGNTNGANAPDDLAGGEGAAPSASHSLVGADATGSLTNGVNGNQVGVTVAQAGLAPLGNYGGPTPTFALLPGSLALGAGQTESGATDQRGFARPNGAPGDVGAFQSTPLVVNSAGDADAQGLLTLRDAVNLADADATSTPEPITFDSSVFATPRTITLTGSALTLGPKAGSSVAPITITGSAAGVTLDGGGLSTVLVVNAGVTAALSGLTITGGSNAAGLGGGIDNAGVLMVSDSTFAANSAAAGGGIGNKGTLTVSDSTFAANSAAAGGGIGNKGTLTVSDSTFFGNSGGGVFNGGTAVLIGDIVVGNTGATSADDLAGSGVDPSSGHNLVGADATGSLTNGVNGNQVGVTVAQAGLAPLGNYGGPTPTFALLPGSLALGAGVTETTQTFDQRGVARPVGVPIDVGAFQAFFPPANVQLAFSAFVTQKGQPVTLNGSFADPRANAAHAVTIVWDDGSSDTLNLAAGVFTFSAAHTYAAEGDYFPTVVVANTDGRAAAGSEEQVLPAAFLDVVDLTGVPGQTLSGAATDPASGDALSVRFTISLTDVGVGEFLAAQLAGEKLPSEPGVVEFAATYDFREHNLTAQDSVRVVLVIQDALAAIAPVEFLYLDPHSGQLHPFRGDIHFAQGPGVLVVTLTLNNGDTPRLVDLTTTVFTVAVGVPGAAVTTAVSAPVASADAGATAPVQTATFQSSSQLSLTLATTQLGQVSQNLSSLSGGGEADGDSPDTDDGLARLVAKELEALWRSGGAAALRLLAHPPQNPGPSVRPDMGPSAPPPSNAPEAKPPQQQAPENLSVGRWPLPTPGPAPRDERKTTHAAPAAVYVVAAPLIGAALGVGGRKRKVERKDDRVPPAQ